MKGFPNQATDLSKLSIALVIASKLAAEGKSARKDDVYGEALVRGGVAGTGHTPRPIEEYLAAQNKKTPPNRSYYTTARGLRELFNVLGVMEDNGQLTELGKLIVATWKRALTPEVLALWRSVIRDMSHYGNYGTTSSHPYQVLLRLIANRPGITRAKCALALEAKDDSEAELARIVALSDLEEGRIVELISATRPNWDNAKKVLPSFAEQLGDATKTRGQRMYLAKAPGSAISTAPAGASPKRTPVSTTARGVTGATIATAGTVEFFDEAIAEAAKIPTAEEVAAKNERLAERLKRHNLLVQKIAAICETNGATLLENPFDCLATFPGARLLIEAKSLGGTEADEVARVREALAQLLYYEAFAIGDRTISVMKVAVFEGEITADHVAWLSESDVHAVWQVGAGFGALQDTVDALGRFLGATLTAS